MSAVETTITGNGNIVNNIEETSKSIFKSLLPPYDIYYYG